MTEPRYLSQSEYKTFKTCRRRWYLEYYRQLGLPPETQSVVGVKHLGIAVHLAMEGHYGHGLDALAVLQAHYTELTQQHPESVTELVAEHAYAQTMTRGYLEWSSAQGMEAEYEVTGTETGLEFPLQLGPDRQVTLRGRLDQVIRRRGGDGVRLLRDWKTVSTFIKPDALHRDEQMRFYALLQRLSAPPEERVDGALYTMLLRSKRTARAKPPFFAVAHVRYNEHDYSSMTLRVRQVAAELLRLTELLDAGADHRAVAYPTPGDYCAWACPFSGVCTMADDGSRFEDDLNNNYIHAQPMAHYANDRIEHVKELLGG